VDHRHGRRDSHRPSREILSHSAPIGYGNGTPSTNFNFFEALELPYGLGNRSPPLCLLCVCPYVPNVRSHW
jgi:hypothetical protein